MSGDRQLSAAIHHRIVRSCPVETTPRVVQMSGLFDVAPAVRSELTWEFDFDPPETWNIGLIVGPSGSGKTTAARELFGARVVESWPWPECRSILDGFPAHLGIKEVVELLSSVGFSSPPSWLRPYRVLSTGERFRADLARTLAECPDLAVVDEFTSVVDRTVAQVGSAAVAKPVRRRNQKFVAVSCHNDIEDWLDPDWVFEPGAGAVRRRSLRGRPRLELEIRRVASDIWPIFRHHHYLDTSLNKSAQCFAAFYRGGPIAFDSYLHQPHPRVRDIKISHRLVVLPDYQGLGIGGRFQEWLGEYLAVRGYRYHNATAHPALIAHYRRSPRWKVVSGGRGMRTNGLKDMRQLRPRPTSEGARSSEAKQLDPRRMAVWSFEYVPERHPLRACVQGG